MMWGKGPFQGGLLPVPTTKERSTCWATEGMELFREEILAARVDTLSRPG